MLINAENLANVKVGFRKDFNDGLALAPTQYKQLAMEVPSSGSEEQYKWLGGLPAMKKWLGDRAIQKLKAYSWPIVNEPWANGIEVDRDDLADDKLGLIRPKIQQLGMMAELHKDQLLFDLLSAGFTTTSYDGQFFFDTDHQDADEPAQSNKGTAALAATSYNNAIQAMMEITDENGEPLEIQPTHLVYGPSNRSVARALLLAERNANGASNTDAGTTTPILSKRLVGSSADYWFLLALGNPIRPLVYQNREPLRFAAQDSPEDEHAFMRRVFRYGSDARYNMGYGLWQMAWGSDGTT